MRPVSIVGVAATATIQGLVDDVALLVSRVTGAALADAGLDRRTPGFTCSGSSDYIQGRPFSFVQALDGVGAWPPISESHVEMDGAWALQEAWVHLQTGHIDVALVYAWGHGTRGDPEAVLALSHDPYTLAPLGIGPTDMAALQARVLLERGLCTRTELAAIAARDLAAVHGEAPSVDELLSRPLTRDPLHAHDGPVWADGAACVVLAAGDALADRPHRQAWIRHLDHRIDTHHPGHRDLTAARSATLSRGDSGPVDVAELTTCWTPQEVVLRRALGLGDRVRINPSGGPRPHSVPMVDGLRAFVHATEALRSGTANRALAHATAGPCLQQNLVGVLEGS
jgi:acetyl-CoA acetyltransferase